VAISSLRSKLESTCVVAVLAAVSSLIAACSEDEAPATVRCAAAGYVSDPNAQSFCGCRDVYLRCSAGGATPTAADCICLAEAGSCPSSADGHVFCGGGTGYRCTAGTIKSVLQCPGSADCIKQVSKDLFRCGTEQRYIDYAVEGEPCMAEQGAACAFDQSSVLDCQRGTWTKATTCSDGAKRCERVFQGDPGVNCAGGSAACYGCGRL
jgi:hypothetical protein